MLPVLFPSLELSHGYYNWRVPVTVLVVDQQTYSHKHSGAPSAVSSCFMGPQAEGFVSCTSVNHKTQDIITTTVGGHFYSSNVLTYTYLIVMPSPGHIQPSAHYHIVPCWPQKSNRCDKTNRQNHTQFKNQYLVQRRNRDVTLTRTYMF